MEAVCFCHVASSPAYGLWRKINTATPCLPAPQGLARFVASGAATVSAATAFTVISVALVHSEWTTFACKACSAE